MLKFNMGDWQKDEDGQYKRVGDLPYTVELVGGKALTFHRGEAEKLVKVSEDDDYVYKILKRSIKARGGAAGLYSFLAGELAESSTGGFFPVVCDKVFDCMA